MVDMQGADTARRYLSRGEEEAKLSDGLQQLCTRREVQSFAHPSLPFLHISLSLFNFSAMSMSLA